MNKNVSKKSINEEYKHHVCVLKGSKITNYGFEYKNNDVMIAVSAIARCNPSDVFDLETGIDVAREKIANELEILIESLSS